MADHRAPGRRSRARCRPAAGRPPPLRVSAYTRSSTRSASMPCSGWSPSRAASAACSSSLRIQAMRLSIAAPPAALPSLVAPVRGHAELACACIRGCGSAPPGGLALRPDHRGVQRAIAVRFGPGDVVVEPARHRQPERVHHAQRGGQQAATSSTSTRSSAQVVELADRRILAAHLLPDAEDVLGRPATSPAMPCAASASRNWRIAASM